MTTRILVGHVFDRLAELPAESVHCCVTSPPYYGLRDYGIEPQVWPTVSLTAGQDSKLAPAPFCEHDFGSEGKSGQRLRNGLGSDTAKVAFPETLHPSTGAFCRRCNAWRGSLGLEPTPVLYVEHMVAVFREVRRVLRKDGTLWLNIGDSYAASTKGSGGHNPKQDSNVGSWMADRRWQIPLGIKPKDLLGMPWMLAFALRDDGWYLRSEITWAKRAPMPESVTDRPTSATEKVFLLAKSPRYFYDADAVKETGEMRPQNRFADGRNQKKVDAKMRNNPPGMTECISRNMRNWWLLGPEPFADAHFATFPTEIPRRAILAGTSEKGVCSTCGAPWERMTQTTFRPTQDPESLKSGQKGFALTGWNTPRGVNDVETTGWRSSCRCNAGDPVPATVLDPFAGAGTTLMVADQLQRDCVGIELNPEYAAMLERRVCDDAGMFAEISKR